MTKHASQEYDPFEPGRSTPEFEQYARENYGTGGGAARRGGAGKHAGAQQVAPDQVATCGVRQPQPSAWQQSFPGSASAPCASASAAPRPRPARTAFGLALCILLAVLIEVFGFNLAAFTSLLYPETGPYLVNGADPSAATPLVLDADNNSFEITGLDDEVKSIHFTPTLADPAAAAKTTDGKVQVVMALADEGNANYYNLPAVSVDPENLSTTYIALEPAGNAHSIKVTFTNLSSIGAVAVTNIGLNERVPFSLDPVRLLSVLAVLLVLYAVRPQSGLFSTVLSTRSGRQRLVIGGLIAVQLVVIVALVMSNTHYLSLAHTSQVENQFQYQKLAEALLQGHFYLNDVPSDALLAMDNPYDTAARAAQGVPYLWDHAFFEGRYYVYFGILPCLVFYVPWLLVTGTGFPTWLGVAICDMVYAVGLAYLLANVCRRWFPRTSLGVFVVLDVMLFIAGGGLILARTPSMYFMPEALGLALIAWGLGLWVSGTSRGFIERGKVTAGALLIALTLASRPQMVLVAVFGLVLFWPFLRDSKGDRQARRQVMGAFRAAMVPFVVVIALVCFYNFARFGSPLDFGANYNLTTNDMTHRGFHADRIPFGLYAYLFQPPVLGSQFPFLRQAYLDPAYQGITIYEPMFGGYFFLYPMTFALLALPRVRKGLQAKGLLPLWAACVAVAFVLCVFDLQGAGILMRYICDFGLYFALAAAFVFLELLQVRSSEPLRAGWTAQLGGAAPSTAPASAPVGETVSVYRIGLYFLFGSLLVMAVANTLLWNAFGMY